MIIIKYYHYTNEFIERNNKNYTDIQNYYPHETITLELVNRKHTPKAAAANLELITI